jgi:hypothetical protein
VASVAFIVRKESEPEIKEDATEAPPALAGADAQ